MKTVYLALGTNMGNREDNLKKALLLINKKMPVTAKSWVYQSAPMYVAEQPAFLNMVCAVKTDLSAPNVLRYAKGVESEIGRTPTYRNGPRVMDVDVLFYGDEIVTLKNPDLTIPHMRYAERTFVLQPMVDINPDFVCPKTGKTMQEHMDVLSKKLGAEKRGTDALGIYPYLQMP